MGRRFLGRRLLGRCCLGCGVAGPRRAERGDGRLAGGDLRLDDEALGRPAANPQQLHRRGVAAVFELRREGDRRQHRVGVFRDALDPQPRLGEQGALGERVGRHGPRQGRQQIDRERPALAFGRGRDGPAGQIERGRSHRQSLFKPRLGRGLPLGGLGGQIPPLEHAARQTDRPEQQDRGAQRRGALAQAAIGAGGVVDRQKLGPDREAGGFGRRCHPARREAPAGRVGDRLVHDLARRDRDMHFEKAGVLINVQQGDVVAQLLGRVGRQRVEAPPGFLAQIAFRFAREGLDPEQRQRFGQQQVDPAARARFASERGDLRVEPGRLQLRRAHDAHAAAGAFDQRHGLLRHLEREARAVGGRKGGLQFCGEPGLHAALLHGRRRSRNRERAAPSKPRPCPTTGRPRRRRPDLRRRQSVPMRP